MSAPGAGIGAAAGATYALATGKDPVKYAMIGAAVGGTGGAALGAGGTLAGTAGAAGTAAGAGAAGTGAAAGAGAAGTYTGLGMAGTSAGTAAGTTSALTGAGASTAAFINPTGVNAGANALMGASQAVPTGATATPGIFSNVTAPISISQPLTYEQATAAGIQRPYGTFESLLNPNIESSSMASPFVAGAFAVYYSKFGKQTVSKVISDFSSFAPKATDAYTGIKVNRLDFANLFSSGSPVVTTTTTTTTIKPPTTTTIPPTTTTLPPSSTTTVTPSPTTTLPPPQFHPMFTRPILLDLYGGYTTSVYVKYRVPAVGRNIVSHYNLYCNGKDVYTIPTQTTFSIVTYRLAVPASKINYCHITAVSIYGKETYPSSIVRIYPRNK